MWIHQRLVFLDVFLLPSTCHGRLSDSSVSELQHILTPNSLEGHGGAFAFFPCFPCSKTGALASQSCVCVSVDS